MSFTTCENPDGSKLLFNGFEVVPAFQYAAATIKIDELERGLAAAQGELSRVTSERDQWREHAQGIISEALVAGMACAEATKLNATYHRRIINDAREAIRELAALTPDDRWTQEEITAAGVRAEETVQALGWKVPAAPPCSDGGEHEEIMREIGQ